MLILLAIPVLGFAAGGFSNSLHIEAHVPENYGVAFPDNALRFGDFVFGVELEVDTELEVDNRGGMAYIAGDTISVGEVKPGFDSFSFTLVYYGNLSQSYRSEIVVAPTVWLLEGSSDVVDIPLDIILTKNPACDSDIICASRESGHAYIEIPPRGPREGVPVLDVSINWEGARELLPGKYSTDLKLKMNIM